MSLCTLETLQVCRAVCHGDLCALVKSYKKAPRMAPYLMDHMLERLRRHHAAALRAYEAPIPLSSAAGILCFNTKKEVGLLYNTKTCSAACLSQSLHMKP
jgi:hypothetical protein